jgi:hypothetical protein
LPRPATATLNIPGDQLAGSRPWPRPSGPGGTDALERLTIPLQGETSSSPA